MKVIFNRFSAKYAKDIKLNLIRELGITRAISIDGLAGHIKPDELAGSKCDYTQMDLWETSNCVYNHVDWNLIPPVDETLAEKLYKTESDVMRLFEKDQTIYTPFNTDTPKSELDSILNFMPERYMQGTLIGMPYDERKRNYYRHVRYWNHILDSEKIDLLIFALSPHFIYEYIIYRLAEAKGIPAIWSYHSAIVGSCGIFEGITDYGKGLPQVMNDLKLKYKNADEITFEKEEFQEEWDRLNEDYKKQTNPVGGDLVLWDDLVKKTNDRFAADIDLNDIGKRKRKFKGLDKFKARWKQISDIDYWHFRLKYGTLNKYTSSLIQYYNSICSEPDLKSNFIYFPLHLQPEDSNAPRAGMYAHQELIVDMLSHFLPDNWYIYIKEHPAQKHKHRSPLFYQYLCNNPKVKLIKTTHSTFELLNYCKAVVTINGTAGWEGLFKGKPCMMYGYFFYKYAPGVYHIRTNEQCKKAVEDIVSGKPLFDVNDLKYFIKAVEVNTFRGGLLAENVAFLNYDDKEITDVMTKAYLDKIKEMNYAKS